MTYKVTSEWVALKRQHAFPSIDFLHPRTFSVDWQNCILVRSLADECEAQSETLEFEYIGGAFRKDAPGIASGERLSTVPSRSLLSLLAAPLPVLFDRQTAIIHSGTLPWRGANAVYFRTIAVPFGNSGGDLTYALVAFSHKMKKETLPEERQRTEFLEYRDGEWSPLADAPEPLRAAG